MGPVRRVFGAAGLLAAAAFSLGPSGTALCAEPGAVPPVDAYLHPPYDTVVAAALPRFDPAPEVMPHLEPGQAVLFHAVCAQRVVAVNPAAPLRAAVVQPTERLGLERERRRSAHRLETATVAAQSVSDAGTLAMAERDRTVLGVAGSGSMAFAGSRRAMENVRQDMGMESRAGKVPVQTVSRRGGGQSVADRSALGTERGRGGDAAAEGGAVLDAATGSGGASAETERVAVASQAGRGGARLSGGQRVVRSERFRGSARSAEGGARLAALAALRVEFLSAAEAEWGSESVRRLGALDSERFLSLLDWYRAAGTLPPLWVAHFLDLLDDEEFLSWEGFYDAFGNPIPVDDDAFEDIYDDLEEYEALDEVDGAGLIDYIVGPLSYPCEMDAGCPGTDGPDLSMAVSLVPEGTPALYHGHGATLRVTVTNEGPGRLCNFLLLVSIPEHARYVPVEGGSGQGYRQWFLRGERTLRLKVFRPLAPGESFRKQIVLRLDPWIAGPAVDVPGEG